MTKPFIYICSLRRTGSTVVAEALTAPPHSFILREPRLARRRFAVKVRDDDLFAEHGFRLRGLAEKWEEQGRPSFIEAFRDDAYPQLAAVYGQVGVKEILNAGWREYIRCFPGLRLILTGRDPRDIFLSMWGRRQAGRGGWQGALTPETLAGHLLEEFEHQRGAANAQDCMKVRYEDFCTQPEVFRSIKRFVDSDIPEMGRIGAFNIAGAKRRDEYELHGDEITAKRVERWRGEENAELRAAADRMIDLMPDYCAFWGYAREGLVQLSE